jgi:hypothetical protein
MIKTRHAIALSTSWLVVFYFVMTFPKFAILMGTAHGPGPFMDLQQVLTAAACRNLPLQDVVEGACDPWNRPWCFGVWIIHIIQFLGFSNDHYLLIGWLNALIISICLGVLTKFFASSLKWAYLAAFSPPIFFLAERGNTDTLIMLLTLIFVFSIIKGKARWFIWIPALLMGAKIYPGGLLLVFSRFKEFVWGVIAAALFALIWLKDLNTILGNQTHCREWSFGNIIYYSQEWRCYGYGVIDSNVAFRLAIVSVLFWANAFLFLKIFKPTWLFEGAKIVKSNAESEILIKASGIVFLISFLGVTVVDYKLWSVALLSFGIMRLDFGAHKKIRTLLFFLVFFGLWGSRFQPSWIQLLANWDLLILTFLVFLYFAHDFSEKAKFLIRKK